MKHPLNPLTLIAGLSGLIYLLIFTLPFPLTRLYAAIPPVDYAKLTRHSPAGFIAYVGGVALLFGLYWWAFRLTAPTTAGGRRSAVSRRFILLSSAFLAALSIPTYPLTAIDLFIYAIRTRGWALYGLNPLATAPETLPARDPWLGLAAEWLDAPSPYGPVWEWLSLAAFQLSGGAFLAHLLLLKVVAALAYLGCVWLIYQIMRQLRSEWAVAGALAFAWSPLVLLENVQNGHNDIIMVFFLLAAVWMMTRPMAEAANKSSSPIGSVAPSLFALRHSPFAYSLPRSSLFALRSPLTQTTLVSLFLALSILVKFVTILVVPFFWLALAAPQPTWRRRVGVAGFSALLIGVIVVLPMLPLWPGWENWAVLTAGSQAGRSLLALLILGLRELLGLSRAFDLSRNALLVIFALIYLYYLWTSFRQAKSSPAPLLACSPAFYTLFWYVLLAAPVFHAWYLLWFVPLAPLLLPNRRPLMASTVFSLTALLIIPYFEIVRVWYPALLTNQFIGHLIGVPLLIGPPALALLWPVDHSANSKKLLEKSYQSTDKHR